MLLGFFYYNFVNEIFREPKVEDHFIVY